jgi:predicted transcriptional regulator
MTQVVLTTRVNQETAALLDKIDEASERSRSWLIAKAIAEYAEREGAFVDFVQVGIDAADAGNLVTHDKVLSQARTRVQGKVKKLLAAE